MKPHTHKQPAKGRARPFAWGRKLEQNGSVVCYALFRRDNAGRLHPLHLQYLVGVAQRSMIARDLMAARKRLRDRVDEIDLQAMEEAA
ncbi:hypothetical protein [Lysobacter sp. F6437]|uniref:hypothetical protein n=1 Tax=Lysobacter sp. F6437 TaxID=3459296 RepID=UPI00403DAA3B